MEEWHGASSDGAVWEKAWRLTPLLLTERRGGHIWGDIRTKHPSIFVGYAPVWPALQNGNFAFGSCAAVATETSKVNAPYLIQIIHIMIYMYRTKKVPLLHIDILIYIFFNYAFNCFPFWESVQKRVLAIRFSSWNLPIFWRLGMYSLFGIESSGVLTSNIIITPALAWRVEVPPVKYCQHRPHVRSIHLEDMVTDLSEWQIWSDLLEVCRSRCMPTAPECLINIVFYPTAFESTSLYHIWFISVRLDCCFQCLI